MRANLQMSSTGEVKSIIVVVMCSRNGKANTKNASIKNNCPFIMYFIRKSALIDTDTNKAKDSFSLSVNPRNSNNKRKYPSLNAFYGVRKQKDDSLIVTEANPED